MRKLFRLLFLIVTFPIIYPISAFTWTIFGLVPVLGLGNMIGCFILMLIGNKERYNEYKESCIESIEMTLGFLYLPILQMIHFYKTGEITENV